MKEVHEETGIICEPLQVISVVDGQRMGFTRFGMYMIVFHCRAVGGEINPHPLETDGAGFFAADDLPYPTAGASWWGPMAFAAIGGERLAAAFEPPRDPVWRGHDG